MNILSSVVRLITPQIRSNGAKRFPTYPAQFTEKVFSKILYSLTMKEIIWGHGVYYIIFFRIHSNDDIKFD
jgi:hypothetical protein